MNFDTYKNTLPFPSKSRYSDEQIKIKRQEYHAETCKLFEKFKQDLFEDLGIEANPKREKLFSIAYDLGHSSGYSEIYNYACELVSLIE